MEKVREKRKRQRRIVGCLAVFLMGSGLWLGIKGYGIAGDAAARGGGLQELQGVRWEKELFTNREEDYHAYLAEHRMPGGFMEDDEAERFGFGIDGYVWDYREGLALAYDLPSSTWYCFDEAGETVFTVKTPARVCSWYGAEGFFQNGLAAISLSDEITCVVDRTGRKVISEFRGDIYMCRNQKAVVVYSSGRGWTWGIARLGEGKLKGGQDL